MYGGGGGGGGGGGVKCIQLRGWCQGTSKNYLSNYIQRGSKVPPFQTDKSFVSDM